MATAAGSRDANDIGPSLTSTAVPVVPVRGRHRYDASMSDHAKRHLHLDPFSGIAGDMLLGALIDLGADADAIQNEFQRLDLTEPFTLSIDRVQRCGVGGVDLKVRTQSRDHGHPHTHDRHHHHVGYREIMAMAERIDFDDRSRKRANRVVTLLADAEARVHAVDLEKIHFHEVGAVDSIVDMLGSVLALQQLDIDTLSCGPVPWPRGYVKCAHGLMPVPAPATAYLLEHVPTVGVDRTGELVTPTGAALIAGLCDSFGPPPAMTLRSVGYGAGDRDDPEVPNLLRVLLGETLAPGDLGPLRPVPADANTAPLPTGTPAQTHVQA